VSELRHVFAAATAPLLLAAFMIAIASEFTPVSVGLVIAAILFGQAFFWLCFIIRKAKGVSRLPPSVAIASVAFVISSAGSVASGLRSHHFGWIWLIRDAVTLALASWGSYMLYTWIRPPLAQGAPSRT
jgi:hypothetical protein